MAALTAFIAALNAAQAINTDASPIGCVGVNMVNNSFVGTLSFQASMDGTNWFGVAAYPMTPSGLVGGAQLTTTAPGQFFIPSYGFQQVRLIATAYTSGNVQIFMDASSSAPIGLLAVNTEGQKPSYTAGLGANTPAATPTDVAVLFGNATNTVRVTRVVLTVQVTAAGIAQYDLVKRAGGVQSAVNTAFAANTHSAKMDSSDPASATIANGLSGLYTSNPASLGTLAGIIESETTALLANGLARIEWNFGNRPSRCPVLRGVTQLLAINGAGHTLLTGEKFGVAFEFTEE